MKLLSKAVLGLCCLLVMGMASLSWAEPVMNLITVNPQDPVGYANWARASSPAIAKSNNAMAMGLCVPRAGAEVMGDVFLWSFFDSQTTAWKVSPMNPVTVAEVAKMDVDRTIRYWDNWRMVREGAELWPKSYLWNVVVKTRDVSGYLSAVDNLMAEMKNNGLGDIVLQAFVADTGKWSGMVMVSMSAKSAERLGNALDARTQPWFAKALSDFGGIREYHHSWALDCEAYYMQEQ